MMGDGLMAVIDTAAYAVVRHVPDDKLEEALLWMNPGTTDEVLDYIKHEWSGSDDDYLAVSVVDDADCDGDCLPRPYALLECMTEVDFGSAADMSYPVALVTARGR
jgi:hypothetical protein